MARIRLENKDALRRVRAALSDGGVVVVPTDTLYGLSAAISSRSGYDRIVSIKAWGPGRPFLYLASSVQMVERYIADWGCASRSTFEEVWPAPLTAVFRASEKAPDWIGETIALRVPSHAFVVELVAALGEPILSTSVNVAGGAPLGDVDEIERRFGVFVDLIVDSGPLVGTKPSTLVDFTGPKPKVLRQGGYVWGRGKPSK